MGSFIKPEIFLLKKKTSKLILKHFFINLNIKSSGNSLSQKDSWVPHLHAGGLTFLIIVVAAICCLLWAWCSAGCFRCSPRCFCRLLALLPSRVARLQEGLEDWSMDHFCDISSELHGIIYAALLHWTSQKILPSFKGRRYNQSLIQEWSNSRHRVAAIFRKSNFHT